MSKNNLPERLPTRLKIPDGPKRWWKNPSVRPPVLFYQEHPEYKRGELIYDPNGSNKALLKELFVRAKAHKVTVPFLVTDVLFADEMKRVSKDWLPLQALSDHLQKRAYNRQKWSEFRIMWESYRRSLQIDLELRNIKTVFPETKTKVLNLESEIYAYLTPTLLKHIQQECKQNEPVGVAKILAEIIVGIEKHRKTHFANIKNAKANKARKCAMEIAQEKWEEDPSLTKRELCEFIQSHFKSEDRDYTLETISSWLTPVVPKERKSGGRPRKH